ncbi:hypothetical protein H5410_060366 [Solanum commersonii]|uniref:RING-type E3 ubiquitin transferase n=1 Tax=Solanum commersonii TaxID=4109 RepID=A0A9J5W5U2_SOLCO|nr:hypothetical protein H5410_060366 [Solanum commersonii]
MTSTSHRSRIFYIRPESRLIGMVPNILGIYHSFDGSLIIVLANGTNIYYVSIVPRNPFSFWIPQGLLTNTMIPNFSLLLPCILWNYTPRFVEVNHAFDRITLPLLLTNFPMTENVNTRLSREVIFARMNRIMYQPTKRSISDDNDTCSICLFDGQIIGSADCHHTFHFDCISQWLMQKNSCPLYKRIAFTTNTIFQNDATYDFGPLRTMTFASHRSRIFYIRPESRLIGMVPNFLRNYYSSDGNLIIVLANGTNIYYVSIVPRNPFPFWIPQGMLTNTMIPNFSLSLPRILWNYTPRFAEVNHAFDGLLALQDQTKNVSTGLSREVIFARMNRIIIFCIRSESRLIGMVPNILRYYYSSDGSLIVVLANGTNIYYVSIVPKNPFSFWIPQEMLTNTMIPNFSLSLPRILLNYTPRFTEVNHAFDHMTLPLRLTKFSMGLLALQDLTKNVNTGLSREIMFARMNRIMMTTMMGRSLQAPIVSTPFTLIASVYGSCRRILVPFAKGLHWQFKKSKL